MVFWLIQISILRYFKIWKKTCLTLFKTFQFNSNLTQFWFQIQILTPFFQKVPKIFKSKQKINKFFRKLISRHLMKVYIPEMNFLKSDIFTLQICTSKDKGLVQWPLLALRLWRDHPWTSLCGHWNPIVSGLDFLVNDLC